MPPKLSLGGIGYASQAKPYTQPMPPKLSPAGLCLLS